jgi:hypothetical protein
MRSTLWNNMDEKRIIETLNRHGFSSPGLSL